ncbi:hypothetical protein HTY53_03085 [Cupriavidus gilardii]|nr:hypothetical protein [Cupriavidus gilardii]
MIYILEDKTTSRSRSFLSAYFDNAYVRAKKWNQYAIEKDDKDVIATSSDRMNLVQTMRGWVVGLDDAEAWPDARRRLRLIGAEHFYHDVFAPASDSVHTLGEDAFNNWFFERTNEECDPKLIRGVLHAEKGSYAIYMSTNALSFYTEIVRSLVGSAGNEEAHQHATSLIETLNTLLSEFTTLSTATVDK